MIPFCFCRSAATVQQPYRIVFHTDSGEPTGAYWNSLKAEVPCLVVEYLPKPTALFGKILTDVQQQSHIARQDTPMTEHALML